MSKYQRSRDQWRTVTKKSTGAGVQGGASPPDGSRATPSLGVWGPTAPRSWSFFLKSGLKGHIFQAILQFHRYIASNKKKRNFSLWKMKSYYWGATAISTYLGCSAGLATFLGLAAAFLGVAAAAADMMMISLWKIDNRERERNRDQICEWCQKNSKMAIS